MSEKIICEQEDLVAIADAVRSVSGTNEKMNLNQMATTVSSLSIGNPSAVLYVEQELTEAQKAQARENIGANDEIYVGNGNMPEGITIQILTDGSDAETELKNELKEYIDNNFGALTLDKHTDGLIYLFRNGLPVGNGISITGEVVEGDLFGYVDENNNIVLRGALANGTYTVKYEMDNGTVVNVGNMVLDTNVYYSVKNTLTNCSTNNSTTTVVKDGSYSATIAANSGHNIISVKVTMGGTDITSSAYSNGKITITNVTGNIVITATASANTYSVTKNLTNCSISNSATAVSHGASYYATVTANSGYELKSVTATMGGSAVVVTGGGIAIPVVTGNIVITAVAENSEPKGNLADPTSADWLTDTRLATGYGYGKESQGSILTNYIPAKRGDVLRVKGLNLFGVVNSRDSAIGCYTSTDKTADSTGKYNSYDKLYTLTSISNSASGEGAKNDVSVSGDVYTYTILMRNGAQHGSSGVNYIRISAPLADGYTANDVVITINEEIVNDDNGGNGGDSGGTSTSYTNLLPLSVDTDGSEYVGKDVNGGDGYECGYKLSGSSAGGTPSTTPGAYVSGFMPVTLYDTVRIKNIALYQGVNVNNIIFYNASKGKVYAVAGSTGNCFHPYVTETNGVYKFQPKDWTADTSVAFFRFSCGGITDDTIVTVNQDIV